VISQLTAACATPSDQFFVAHPAIRAHTATLGEARKLPRESSLRPLTNMKASQSRVSKKGEKDRAVRDTSVRSC